MSEEIHGRLSREELRDAIGLGDVDTVIVVLCDTQGRLVGKRLDGEFFLHTIDGGVVEGCSYILATDVDMKTVDGYALTSWERGYGDLAFHPDFSSTRVIPWHHKTVMVFADATTTTGEAITVAPRRVLQRQVAALEERGWRALVGTELEFMVFHETYEQAWSQRYEQLSPVNQYNVDYAIQGSSRVEPLLGRLRRSMRSAGMTVESSKGECNFGQHEIAFRYAGAVDKCDEHSLFKLGAKEIAAQENCSLTFMAKFNEREGNSCHIHLSLRDAHDRAVFPGDNPDSFSPVFENFLAGLLAYTRELSVLLAPNVNSYKRFVKGSFAPTTLVWGRDNRTCAYRVVGHGENLRVECRIPGGDVNPYIATSALLAAGLAGVEQKLPLSAETTGDAYLLTALRMPESLADAVQILDESEMARRSFGDDVIDHYVHAARIEIAQFNAAVTDWERVRNFERL